MGCAGSKGGQSTKGGPKPKPKSEAYEQAGGHAGGIVFDGEKITKQTKKSEVDNYKAINEISEDGETSLNKLKPFVSTYYDAKEIENDEKGKWSITIQNLLYGKEKGSFMDIKLGTSSETEGASEEKQAKRLAMDKERCTFEHGLTVVGVNLKDPTTGESKEKINKLHPKTIEESKDWIRKLFQQTEDGKIDQKAVSYVSQELAKMAEYFKNVNEHTIRGMSLFIVIDSRKQNYGVSLIDLVSMSHIDQSEGPKRDDGLIKGFNSLLDIVGEI